MYDYWPSIGVKGVTDRQQVEAASTGQLLGGNGEVTDVGRRAFGARDHILEFQRCISSIERCDKREKTQEGIPLGDFTDRS